MNSENIFTPLSHIALTIEGLTVIYKNDPVLSHVNFAINRGLLVGIIGPNGAGKSTLFKAILGLVKPTTGTIKIFGQNAAKQSSLIAYVPQRTAVDWDFPVTVFDVVLMGCYGQLGWFRRPNELHKQKAHELLKKVGLDQYALRPIGQLSGGQQQRVFLARALMQDPEIYFLDEPFNGIDKTTERLIIAILKDLVKAGKTVLVIHHDVQTLADYFDYLLLLNTAQIAYGPVDVVLKQEYMCAAYGDNGIFIPRERISL